ncbi:similar to Saccharomyces cerevisiae YMR147W Putative protein of unknown function [Maudiozyma saulgeensis]|uniref:Uncharacterized protein n=1 Tax=Maudiozyma saulgeensis TaxID=1789683 RepID=A0A1X7R0I2_9SACH|nr:similar to Saccharomyces cerevisiae YMR147W Putative protein of unknown function [Kazachstania saulgeensis]
MNMTAILNESKVHERRSKTFSDLKKNSNEKDISNVKFYSFIPENNFNNQILNTNPKDSLDISFIPKKKNYENHFTSINKTDSNLISLDEEQKNNKKENFNDFKKKTIDNAKTLDTIDETSDDKLSLLMDSCRTIDLTKDEADTIMLNFVLNNENTLYKKKNKNQRTDDDDLITIGDKSVTTGNKIFPFNSTLQKYWFTIFVKTGFILEKMEIILYENFWFTLLYLNFWFPNFAGFLRYVQVYF